MGVDDRRLADVARAILDGTPVDWASAASSADEAERPLIDQLRVLASVADLHRNLLFRGPSHSLTSADNRADSPECWGHLRVLEPIGRGAFGDVYRAWDTRLDREVALKLLPAGASVVDSRAVAAGLVAAVALHDSQRAAADGGDRLSILFRWFIGLRLDEPIWSPTTFSKNRDRLQEGDIAAAFFDAVRGQAEAAGLLSDEHFTVDSTMLEAWASLKSFQRKDAGPSARPDDPENPTVNFHGESRTNDTHASTAFLRPLDIVAPRIARVGVGEAPRDCGR